MAELLNVGDLVASREASELTGYTSDYLRMLARDGKILSQRVAGRWLFDKSDLLRYKAEMDNLGTMKHAKPEDRDTQPEEKPPESE